MICFTKNNKINESTFYRKDLQGISMFLNPKEHTNLYMTAKDIIATTPKQELESSSELEQEQDQLLIAQCNRLRV